MSKKPLMALAPLLATIAVAAMPAAAQATEPHWYGEGASLAQGQLPIPVIEWGTITFKEQQSPGYEITCHISIAGHVGNPDAINAQPAGTGTIDALAPSSCMSPNIPCTPSIEAQGPMIGPSGPEAWTTELNQIGPSISENITNVKLVIGCAERPYFDRVGVGTTFVNKPGVKWNPLAPQKNTPRSGTSALHPGYFEFGVASGELEGPGGVTLVAEGKLKILGYEEQELIQVKNP
jgi:hypothetical protein